jgi:UDP-glucose 4-epimerase
MATAKTVLITGGAGYIGSVTTEVILEHGYRAIVLDNLSRGYRDAVHPDAEFVNGDVGDRPAMRQLLGAHEISAVIHMAALIEVGESMREPLRYIDNNFVRPLALLQAMKEAGTRIFVLSSTAATYGMPETTPITEDAPNRPINPYGLSKLMLEQALACHTIEGLHYAALRYFNAAGATQRSGERHRPETHLIPLVLQAAAGERPAIEIFGSDYDTPDGTCIRDYIHVRDLAEAHVVALRRLEKEAEAAPASAPAALPAVSSRAWNLGNGNGFSVREVIAAAERVTRRKIPVRESPRRPGDPARLVASSAKMRAAGWKPQYPDLEEIVGSAWRWRSRAAFSDPAPPR